MTNWRTLGGVGLSVVAALALCAVGCNDTTKGGSARNSSKDTKVAQSSAKEGDHKHDAWWCDEHGIPEAECSMCSSKVAAECKKKGDWCDKHDRAKSQCFLCDPKLKEKYAAQYRAKYGKEPPPTEDDDKAKKDKEPKKDASK